MPAVPADHELARMQSRLGYKFADRILLHRALTHRSRGQRSNERLEFLGDSLLGFVIAAELYARFPQAAEGSLSRMRARLVCNKTLAEYARALWLPKCLMVGGGARNANGGEIDSVLAGALEAVVAAIYLDGGFGAAEKTLLKLFADDLQTISPHGCVDAKTKLQQRLQKNAQALPRYEIIKQAGKPNAPTFSIACNCEALPEAAVGEGRTRREAEQRAAANALKMLDADAN